MEAARLEDRGVCGAVKVAGGLAVEAARVATGGVVVKTAEEASVQAASWAALRQLEGPLLMQLQ